jgi:Cys-rich protein (TIGR01571 family)
MIYTTAFILTVMLIFHIVRAIYCLEIDIFENNIEEPMMREEEGDEIEINSIGDNSTCNFEINKAYLLSILVLDALLWGYIMLLISRTRTAVREHHYIYGGPIEDCCVSCCCNCCTLTQLVKETSYEDHEIRRLSNVDVSVGEPGEFLNENNREGQHRYRPIV